MPEIKTIQLHEETYNELLKHKDDSESFEDALRRLLDMPINTNLDELINEALAKSKAIREKSHEDDKKHEEEIKKRAHLFEKFIVSRPAWMFSPGVTRITFDGNSVTFSRKGKESHSIPEIRKCTLTADNYHIKRNESEPFDVTTKHAVDYHYPVSSTFKGATTYNDGTEMGISIETKEHKKQSEEEEKEQMKELWS